MQGKSTKYLLKMTVFLFVIIFNTLAMYNNLLASEATKYVPFVIIDSCKDSTCSDLAKKVDKAVNNHYTIYKDSKNNILYRPKNEKDEFWLELIIEENDQKKSLSGSTTNITVTWNYLQWSNSQKKSTRQSLLTLTSDQNGDSYQIKKSYIQILDTTTELLLKNKIVP